MPAYVFTRLQSVIKLGWLLLFEVNRFFYTKNFYTFVIEITLPTSG